MVNHIRNLWSFSMPRRSWSLRARSIVALVVFIEIVLGCQICLHAQERPYFVTYSQEMEEPGNLDLETFNVVGNPKGGDAFIGSDIEFEYGVKTWWTTEFYL